MQQTTKTFVQLCNEVIREAGGELASFALDGSDFVNPTDKMQINIKEWVKDAWRDLQQDSFDLEWMSSQAVVNIQPGIMFYSPSAITWNQDDVNPLIIYDTDATPRVQGNTVLGVVDLTGIYTRTENFGYIDLQSGLSAPLNFGLKAGGEYFSTHGSGLDYIVFSSTAQGFARDGDGPITLEFPTLATGFENNFLTKPAAGTSITKLRLVIFSHDDYSVVTNTAYDIAATITAGGSPASRVLNFTTPPTIETFIDAYVTAIQYANVDDNDTANAVVGVYMEDSDGGLYGGLVKWFHYETGDTTLHASGYSMAMHLSAATINIVADDQGWVDGGVIGTVTVGDTFAQSGIVLGNLAFSESSVSTNTLSFLEVEERISLAITNEADDSSLSTDLIQDIALSRYATGFGSSDGVSRSVQCRIVVDNLSNMLSITTRDDSNFAHVKMQVDVEAPVPTKINYIHSWKSFDWEEESDDDDFQEAIRQVNDKTFRIIAHEQPAIAPEKPLDFCAWSEFQNRYDFASSIPSMPRIVTEDNQGRWRFFPPPDMPYTILFNYVRTPQELALYNDVPKGLSDEYWKLITWKALEYYGLYDEQPSIASANPMAPGRAQRMYKNLLMKYELQFRPKFHFVPRRLY